MQVFVARDDLGQEAYQLFKKFDIGDILGIEGDLFRTKTGELTIRAKKVDLVTKSMELAREALALVGLRDRMGFAVTTLSGGERQRAAIARAILLRPKAVLADEPTGNLDERNGAMIGELLHSLNQELGMTFVVVTHNIDLAGVMERRLELRSGVLYAQG